MYILNENIHRLRKNAGITQEELAKRIGVSKGTISNYENDITRPACSKLSKIADALGVSVRELFEGTVRKGTFNEMTEYLEAFPNEEIKQPASQLTLTGVPHVYIYDDENGDVVVYESLSGDYMLLDEYNGGNVVTDYDGRVCIVNLRSHDGEQMICGDRPIGQIISSRTSEVEW